MTTQTIHHGRRFRVRHFPRSSVTLLEESGNVLHMFRGTDAQELAGHLQRIREIFARGDDETLVTAKLDDVLGQLYDAHLAGVAFWKRVDSL